MSLRRFDDRSKARRAQGPRGSVGEGRKGPVWEGTVGLNADGFFEGFGTLGKHQTTKQPQIAKTTPNLGAEKHPEGEGIVRASLDC